MKKFLRKLKNKIRGCIRKTIKYLNFKVLVPMTYRRYRRLPKNDKLVLFADLRARDTHENFVGLMELCRQNGYEPIAINGKGYAADVPRRKATRERLKFQRTFLKLYSQCRALFIVEYFPLADAVKPREGTEIIQLWHGCGAMKTMGYAGTGKGWGASERDKKRYPMHQHYSLVPISSGNLAWCYEEAFQIEPGIVKGMGMPRTDIYFDQEYVANARANLLKHFPEIGDRKVILFAPTFRGKSIKKSYYNLDLDFRKYKKALGDKYVFITKFHPLMAKGGLTDSMKIMGADFVFDATYVLSPEEALCAADILIGDYSSIGFEYMLLERPILAYIPDLDQYLSDRGLFYPYNETMPGPYAFDPDELLEQLMTVDEWFDIEKTRRYREKFMGSCDGHSTERIFHYVFDKDQK